ncbi:TPA: DNA mismatch repair endonuclease MutL, partial [Enterococcus faecium]
IPSAADNLRFKKKVPDQPKTEQIEIDLSYAFEEEKPKKPSSLNFDRETGTFFVEEPKSTFVDRSVDKSVENVKNFSGFSEGNTSYPEKTAKTVDKFGENVDNFVEKTVEKSEKKEIPTVDNT